MIDISDGLAADLHHLLDESGVGAVIEAGTIPIHGDVGQPADGCTPLDHALADGEDFELLFTVAADDGPRLLSAWNHSTPLSVIGHIRSEPGCRLQSTDGRLAELPPLGWTHPLSDGTTSSGR
jgi:thiamine-monophosphate kinase